MRDSFAFRKDHINGVLMYSFIFYYMCQHHQNLFHRDQRSTNENSCSILLSNAQISYSFFIHIRHKHTVIVQKKPTKRTKTIVGINSKSLVEGYTLIHIIRNLCSRFDLADKRFFQANRGYASFASRRSKRSEYRFQIFCCHTASTDVPLFKGETSPRHRQSSVHELSIIADAEAWKRSKNCRRSSSREAAKYRTDRSYKFSIDGRFHSISSSFIPSRQIKLLILVVSVFSPHRGNRSTTCYSLYFLWSFKVSFFMWSGEIIFRYGILFLFLLKQLESWLNFLFLYY